MKCMTPGCTDAAKSRGLCRNCYAAANYQILKGRQTWDSIVAAGRAKSSEAKKSKFTASLKESDHPIAVKQAPAQTISVGTGDNAISSEYPPKCNNLAEKMKMIADKTVSAQPLPETPDEREQRIEANLDTAHQSGVPPLPDTAPPVDPDADGDDDFADPLRPQPSRGRAATQEELTECSEADPLVDAKVSKVILDISGQIAPSGRPQTVFVQDDRPKRTMAPAGRLSPPEKAALASKMRKAYDETTFKPPIAPPSAEDEAARCGLNPATGRRSPTPPPSAGEPMQQSIMAPSEHQAKEAEFTKRAEDDAALGKALGHVPFVAPSRVLPELCGLVKKPCTLRVSDCSASCRCHPDYVEVPEFQTVAEAIARWHGHEIGCTCEKCCNERQQAWELSKHHDTSPIRPLANPPLPPPTPEPTPEPPKTVLPWENPPTAPA